LDLSTATKNRSRLGRRAEIEGILKTILRVRKSNGGGGGFFRTLTSLVYALLCLGMIGFFVWIWWRPNSGNQLAPAPVPASVAPVRAQTPAPAPKPAPVALSPADNRPVQTILEAQIALARQGISSGSMDGVAGSQTRSALIAFQKKRGLPPTGLLDPQTRALLTIASPALTQYTVTTEDLTHLTPVPKTWLAKSQLPRLNYENILELLGEKTFSNPQLIRQLNPNLNWNAISNGLQITVPRVEYPPPADKAAFIKISLQQCILEAFDSESNLLAHFPCSIGRIAAKRPVGELHVTTIAPDPNYTFDPAVFPESPEAQSIGRKLIIPPGPNNPVGVVWIGLDRPGYGIHGTPAPEQVGRTESHGCFRLANWNARYLADLVWIGITVDVE
jgi:lipoprotein-anchoring transpeptidase ErfK/SrfK